MKAQLQHLNNVKFVLGTDRDPKLPADTLEGVLVLDVYHHFDYPEAMLEHIRDSLVSDGKLVIVEYFKRRGAMQNRDPDRPLRAHSPRSRRCDQGSGSQRIPAGLEARFGAKEPIHRGFCEEVRPCATIRLRPAANTGEVAEWSKAAVC